MTPSRRQRDATAWDRFLARVCCCAQTPFQGDGPGYHGVGQCFHEGFLKGSPVAIGARRWTVGSGRGCVNDNLLSIIIGSLTVGTPATARSNDKFTVRDFRSDCLRELKKIKKAWPDLHYRTVTGALLLSPSPPRIAPSQLRLVE